MDRSYHTRAIKLLMRDIRKEQGITDRKALRAIAGSMHANNFNRTIWLNVIDIITIPISLKNLYLGTTSISTGVVRYG